MQTAIRMILCVILGYLVSSWATIAMISFADPSSIPMKAVAAGPAILPMIVLRDLITLIAPVDWAPARVEHVVIFIGFPALWFVIAFAFNRIIRRCLMCGVSTPAAASLSKGAS